MNDEQAEKICQKTYVLTYHVTVKHSAQLDDYIVTTYSNYNHTIIPCTM